MQIKSRTGKMASPKYVSIGCLVLICLRLCSAHRVLLDPVDNHKHKQERISALTGGGSSGGCRGGGYGGAGGGNGGCIGGGDYGDCSGGGGGWGWGCSGGGYRPNYLGCGPATGYGCPGYGGNYGDACGCSCGCSAGMAQRYIGCPPYNGGIGSGGVRGGPISPGTGKADPPAHESHSGQGSVGGFTQVNVEPVPPP